MSEPTVKRRRRKDPEDHPEDFYPTPGWCVRALQEAVELPGGHWLEPAAGDGAIVRAFAHRVDITWDLVEIRQEAAAALNLCPGNKRAVECPTDYLTRRPVCPMPGGISLRYQVAITNPPFDRAARFIGKLVEEADVVVALLRLSFLESEERNRFLVCHQPDVLVLPRRPSFSGDGTDNSAYAWFIWHYCREPGDRGEIEVLPLDPGQLELGAGR